MTVDSATSRRTVFLVLTALVLAEVVSAVEATMIFAALRVFYKDFGDPVLVGWIVTAFLLVAAASASVCSRLGDMHGRRRMLLGVLAFAGVGSVVSGVSDSAAGIIAGRAIQGLSGAVLPLCFGLVRENLPMRRVPFGIGVISAAAFVSGGAAIFLGGVIVDQLSSPWIFHVGAATAVVAWVAVLAWVPKSARAPSSDPIDIVGAVLLVPAITGLLLALSQAKVWGWGDARTLSLTAGCLVVLALWTLHELRTKAPLIDVRLLGNRQLALANLGVVVLALGPLQSGLVLSLLLQQPQWTGIGLGLTATMAGAILAPPMMLAIFVGPGCGGLAARYGARVPALLACVCLFVGWGGIAIHHDSVPFVAAMIALQGVGMAMAYAAAPMLIVEVAPEDRTSEVTGVSSIVRYIFSAVGSQVVAVLLAQSTVSNAALGPGVYPAASTFVMVLSLIAALSVAGLLITLALPRRSVGASTAEPLLAKAGA